MSTGKTGPTGPQELPTLFKKGQKVRVKGCNSKRPNIYTVCDPMIGAVVEVEDSNGARNRWAQEYLEPVPESIAFIRIKGAVTKCESTYNSWEDVTDIEIWYR